MYEENQVETGFLEIDRRDAADLWCGRSLPCLYFAWYIWGNFQSSIGRTQTTKNFALEVGQEFAVVMKKMTCCTKN